MMFVLNLLFFTLLSACKSGSENPESLAKSMAMALGDSDKMLSLMADENLLKGIMDCASDNALLGRLARQRQALESSKNTEAGFKLEFQSAEVLQTQKVEKGQSIPFSLSKCKAKQSLMFTKIKGTSNLIDKQVKMPKETEFSAIGIDGRWHIFILSASQ